MKFTNSIAVLLAATSALAFTFPEDTSAECKNELTSKLQACYDMKGDLNTFCTSECEEFFNNPNKFIPHCMNNIFNDNTFKFGKMNRVMACNKDESGKQCPFGPYVDDYIPDKDKLIAETCVSAACTKATLEFYRTLEPIVKPVDAALYRDFIEKLSSDECKAKQSSSSSSSSSDSKKTDDKTSSDNNNGSSSAPAANGAAPATNGSTPAPTVNGSPIVNGNSTATNSTTPAGNAASSDATSTKVGTTLMVSLGLLLLSYF